jgi:hypothetical protein
MVDTAPLTMALERRLRWLVDALIDPSAVAETDIAAAYDATGWGDWSPARELEFFRNGRHAASRPLTVEDVTVSADDASAILVGSVDGKRWLVSCRVEEEEPHRFIGARTMPAPPVGTTIRLARPEDGPGLAELERHAPLRLGHEPITLMTFDHGDDYFAPSRLMDDCTIYVAEVGGAVAGVYCGAVQSVLLDGEPKRLFLEHHVRIDPATARGGVFWALCTFGRDTYARTTDSIAFYVSVDNHPVRKFVEGTPSWSVRPLRALIPCADVGGGGGAVSSRASTEADAGAICDVLNRCHSASPPYVPYDAGSFGTRLSRDPSQYAWGDVRVSAGGSAVVGIAQRLLGVTKERDGSVTSSRRALVVDHGFAPGGADEYRDLLLDSCRVAGARGATHLAVFTSEPSPTFDVVRSLASEIEEFDFWAFDLPEPAGLREHGFYVDPIYF